MRPRDLEAVREEMRLLDVSLAAEGAFIDPKIRDLVIGFRRWGVETIESCQGHWNWRHNLHYPWVGCDEKSLEIVAALLAPYLHYYRVEHLGKENSRGWYPTWVIKPFFGTFWILPERHEWWRLPWLQKDAVLFGKWLQELPDDFFAKLETSSP